MQVFLAVGDSHDQTAQRSRLCIHISISDQASPLHP
jgi:hypothetical protein